MYVDTFCGSFVMCPFMKYWYTSVSTNYELCEVCTGV